MIFVVLTVLTPTCIAGKPAPPPPPPVTYTVTLTSAAALSSMNEQGFAVGWQNTAMGTRAVVAHASGVIYDLTDVAQESDPNYDWLLLDYATAINDEGQIAGRGWRIENGEPAARLFRYSPADADTGQPATLEAIRTFAPGTIYISGMNDFGDVVLHSSMSGAPTFPSQAGAGDSVWVFSGLPGYGSSTKILDAAIPNAINNLGTVTGAAAVGTSSIAFRLTSGGTFNVFGTVTGGTSLKTSLSDALDINDSDVVAGWSLLGKTKGAENTSQRAVRLRADGTWEDLQGTAVNSWVTAINNSGVTIGFGASSGTGFVHVSGKLYSIRDLIVNRPANLTHVFPEDITDAGQICGEVWLQNADGTRTEVGAIFTPVP